MGFCALLLRAANALLPAPRVPPARCPTGESFRMHGSLECMSASRLLARFARTRRRATSRCWRRLRVRSVVRRLDSPAPDSPMQPYLAHWRRLTHPAHRRCRRRLRATDAPSYPSAVLRVIKARYLPSAALHCGDIQQYLRLCEANKDGHRTVEQVVESVVLCGGEQRGRGRITSDYCWRSARSIIEDDSVPVDLSEDNDAANGPTANSSDTPFPEPPAQALPRGHGRAEPGTEPGTVKPTQTALPHQPQGPSATSSGAGVPLVAQGTFGNAPRPGEQAIPLTPRQERRTDWDARGDAPARGIHPGQSEIILIYTLLPR
ncbi:hypothetical protein B0H11DRAFT_2301769 [Mycena galericulata]|nr:hypothetical protein B0H11DRAFT_2301769 [Mycena galericulata]